MYDPRVADETDDLYDDMMLIHVDTVRENMLFFLHLPGEK